MQNVFVSQTLTYNDGAPYGAMDVSKNPQTKAVVSQFLPIFQNRVLNGKRHDRRHGTQGYLTDECKFMTFLKGSEHNKTYGTCRFSMTPS